MIDEIQGPSKHTRACDRHSDRAARIDMAIVMYEAADDGVVVVLMLAHH